MGLRQLGLVGEFEDGQGGRECEALSAACGLPDSHSYGSSYQALSSLRAGGLYDSAERSQS